MASALNFFSLHEAHSGKPVAADELGSLGTGESVENPTAMLLVACPYKERAALISLSSDKACSAERSGRLVADRSSIEAQEVFRLVPASTEGQFLLRSAHRRFVRRFGPDYMFEATAGEPLAAAAFVLKEWALRAEQIERVLGFENIVNVVCYSAEFSGREIARFKAAVENKTKNSEPVIVLVGPGPNVRDDSLHIAPGVGPTIMRSGWLQHNHDKYFCLNGDQNWEIPDACVDFIFHEDVFEHLNQRSQIQLLAEAFRVLKPGAIHRLNTPCLRESMRVHSNFSSGAAGVYVEEWDRWGHAALVTHEVIKEYASIVGYSRCFPAVPDVSLSPYFRFDTRPKADRDRWFGNVIVDLVK
jgi:hypothetical protein